jgi:beta-1,2-mannobiose phosphorylase / 1,2-beta-oligomannan phosphorylase
MMDFTRHPQNPIFLPNSKNKWEELAAFNGSIIEKDGGYAMLYRAMSKANISVIGLAYGVASDKFTNRKLFITPQAEWEKFGCEDPRVTFLDGKYYIFYTALSNFPPDAAGIKVGMAISKDLEHIDEKHLVTPFNAKAMALFPEKINGKYACILTANTDIPPSKIAVAYFDKEEDMWSKDYWQKWYEELDKHTIPLAWSNMDQVEVGASPIRTPYGWILVYCDFRDYYSPDRIVQVKIALLDLNDPQKVIGVVKKSVLIPQTQYEKEGIVPNTIFPTSALIEGNNFSIYYSAADTSVCMATVPLETLYSNIQTNNVTPVKFTKFMENPILTIVPEHSWENSAVFNPTAIFLNGKVHIIYRAQGDDGVSRFGYATSTDGVTIDERLPDPIYSPREDFESKKVEGGSSGCEDPRITKIGETLYVCYTAFTGEGDARVALTEISVSDFLARKWEAWKKPILITAPGIYDKDACIFPEKFEGKYLFLHRITPGISVDYSDSLNFGDHNWLKTESYIVPHPHRWDNEKIGIGPTPIKTPEGWLLIYHGISKIDSFYRVGAMIMDLNNPQLITARTKYPILEPDEDYEKIDGRGIAFPCGMVELGEDLFIYYGGGDMNVCVAKINKTELVESLVNQSNKKYLKTKIIR